MSATQRPRGKAVTSNGRAMSFNIDPLTHSRIVYATYLITRALDAPASLATVVRSAVVHYLEHLEALAKRLTHAETKTETQELLRLRERYRVLSANRGGDTRWKQFPEDAMTATPLPTWAELVRTHSEPVESLPAPESFGPMVARLNNEQDICK